MRTGACYHRQTVKERKKETDILEEDPSKTDRDAGQTTGRRTGGADAQGEIRGREQDVAEISRRMYEEIKSSRDPRDHVEDG